MARRDLPFTNRNWIILGGGVAVIAAGYGLLSIPPADGFLSLTMAPILLVLGYCVVIPGPSSTGIPKRGSLRPGTGGPAEPGIPDDRSGSTPAGV